MKRGYVRVPQVRTVQEPTTGHSASAHRRASASTLYLLGNEMSTNFIGCISALLRKLLYVLTIQIQAADIQKGSETI